MQMTMTEETQQSETAAQNEAQTSSPDVGKVKDSKKEKCRPMTKVYFSKMMLDIQKSVINYTKYFLTTYNIMCFMKQKSKFNFRFLKHS